MKELNKYEERLYNEWLTHGKIILSVDFDSTIYPYNTIDNKEDIERTIKLTKLAHETGAYIVIFTASELDRYKEIEDYCKKIELHIDAINKNCIPLPYGNNGKIYYNLNLCDRSGLNEALNILETVMYKIRSNKESKRLDYSGSLG